MITPAPAVIGDVTRKVAFGAAADDSGPASLPVTAPRRGRKPLDERIAELLEQQRQLTAQKRDLASQQRAEARKRNARVDAMIASACRADPAIHEAVRIALDKHVKEPNARAFLKAEGWLPIDSR